MLGNALVIPDATDLAKAEELLAQVRRSQAAGVLAAAEEAVRHRDVARAQGLLQAYRADPDAADLERATRLQADLAEATSTEHAQNLLRQLPDAELAAFAAGGTPPALDHFADDALRALYATTLRAGLAAEQQRRVDLRREQEKRQVLIAVRRFTNVAARTQARRGWLASRMCNAARAKRRIESWTAAPGLFGGILCCG